MAVVPEPARTGMHNFLVNLDLPVTFANDVLQGEVDRAGDTLRPLHHQFHAGRRRHFRLADADGRSLPHRGFRPDAGRLWRGRRALSGAALPRPRSAARSGGPGGRCLPRPLHLCEIARALLVVGGRGAISACSTCARAIWTRWKSIERSSVDYYASVRSLYRQMRNNEIRNGRPDVKNLPGF